MPNQEQIRGVLGKSELGKLHRLLKMSSQTYALCIPLLPQPLQEAVIISYLLLRNADTLEDDTRMPVRKRIQLLTKYAQAIELLKTSEGVVAISQLLTDDGELDFEETGMTELFYQSAFIAEQLKKLPPEVAQLIIKDISRTSQAMIYWLKREQRERQLKLNSLWELEQYCYCAAGILGELLTGLFQHYSPQIASERLLYLRTLETNLAFGLQITNIIIDLPKDSRQGKFYIPQDFLNLNPGEEITSKLLPLCGLAYRHLAAGVDYVMALPVAEPGIRCFCLFPVLQAATALNNLLKKERDVSGAADDKINPIDQLIFIAHNNRKIKYAWEQLSCQYQKRTQEFSEVGWCGM